MNKYDIVWTNRAVIDLSQITAFYLDKSYKSAILIKNQIENEVKSISYFPNRGVKVQIDSYSLRALYGKNVRIYYEVCKSKVVIRFIFHNLEEGL